MANDVKSVQLYGDQLKVIFDDGTQQLALPTSAGSLWVAQRKLIPVTPNPPVQSGNYIGIPNVTGVLYLDDGNPVSGTYYIAPGETTHVTAEALPGYALTAGTWAWTFTGPATPTSDFKFPFPRSLLNFTSYYGHSGIDWPGGSVGSSSAIKAIGPGTVIGRTTNTVNNPSNTSEPTWRGCSITLDHGTIGGTNIQSIYAHMVAAPIVNMGDSVTGGQQLGTIGQSGAAYGTHLHLEVVYNGVRLPTSTPGNNTPGLGFQRTLAWLDGATDGSSW